MANTKVTQHVIANNAITADQLASAAVTDAKLHSTLDLSGKTLTLPATAIPSASTATTQSASDNSTKLATTAYVTTAIANLNDSAPTALNTLNELAAALGDDANFSATITTAVGTKLPLAGGTLTGDLILGDGIKLEIGSLSGGDLQIYHSGTNSVIDNNTGGLYLRNNVASDVGGDIFIQAKSGENSATFTHDGAVTLMYDNVAKLATTTTGVSIIGTGALRIPQGTTGQRPTAAVGQIRWNTTDGALEVYNGTAWTAVGTGSSNKVLDTFTGDNSNRTFTLSVTPANEDAIMVFIDGAYQEKGDYVLTNNSLVLDTAPLTAEKIAVHTTTASVHDGTTAVNNQFTATAGQTAFTLTQDPSSENNTQVYINGVYQQKTDYTVVGTTLTFDTGLTVGDVVEVNMFTVATLGNTDTVTEGVGNLYHTTARARSAISVSGNALSYNSSTGVITSAYEESPTFTGNAVIDGTLSVSTVVKLGTWSQDGQTNGFIGFDQSSSDVGLGFGHASGTGRVYYPCRENGSGVSDVISLGTSTYKYKDLHLSGSANVGSIITGAYGAGGSAGDGFRLNSTDLYGQVDASDKVRIAVAADSFFNGGKVGIGTSSPNSLLDLKDVHSQLRLTDEDDDKFLLFSYSGGKLILRNNSTNTTVNQTTLTEDGKFGIGTISPATTLHLDAPGGAVLRMQRISANATNKLELSHDGTNGSISSTNDLTISAASTTFNSTALIQGVSNYTGLEVKGAGGSRPMLKFTNVNNGNLAGIYGTEANSMVLTSGSSNSAAVEIDSIGHVDTKIAGSRMTSHVQDSFHIGAEKSHASRYSFGSGRTYVDGGSSNYAGYVFVNENYFPQCYVPYSPNQVYRISASMYQLTGSTASGGATSRHYFGLAGYDENFNFIQVDGIGTYQYILASNTTVSTGNFLELDVTMKGWQGSGGTNGNKMDQGTVYIRPLILFNYQNAGATAVLTGFNIQPAGTVLDNDSNAGTNY